MAEQLTLTVPVVPASRTTYAVKRVLLDWASQLIEVIVVGSDGEEIRAEYLGAQATALMTTLNTTNLSVLSLHKRVLQKLVVDGKLPAGTVTGVAS